MKSGLVKRKNWLGLLLAVTAGLVCTSFGVGAAPKVSADLVINEIDYDQPSTDGAEFIELKNTASNTINLNGYSLDLINGNDGGALSYRSFDLPDATLPAGGYFVVCADASAVSNCDLDVSPDTNLIQNGAPDAAALMFDAVLIDTVSYEGDTGAPYTEGSGTGLEDDPAKDGWSIGRCPDGSDTDRNNVDFLYRPATPGAPNDCPNLGSCGEPAARISAVQGSGQTSPLVGREPVLEGVVVGDFQGLGGLGGFFLQEESGDSDGDPATSEGIFIDDAGIGGDVNVDDVVRLQGFVVENGGLTTLADISGLVVCGAGETIPPEMIALPAASPDAFERYEGMLVTFPQALVISEYFNFDRYGEIVLTSERHLTPSAEFEPGPDAVQAAQDFLLDRITLDDGRTDQNPDPARHPNGMDFSLTNRFRGGDTLANLTGVMDYAFGLYRIQPTQGADYSAANPREGQPGDVGGSLKVASFNVLNYFTTLDTGAIICGPAANQECRGADDAEEFTRQRDKIIAAIAAIDADVVGLIEIENHPGDVPAADLVEGLNAVVGAGTYAYLSTGAIGTDAIRVAFIYQPASVSLVGSYAVLDSSVDPRFIDTKNRPALAQTFMENATGGVFTAVVNHLKSKGSDCDDVSDPDLGDGAGNCNLTRAQAAEALVDWLATDPTGNGDEDFLIIGDLNSYDKEDPIDTLLTGGYSDLLYQYLGEQAYTYVFDGQLGYLDYALASPGLLGEVTGVTAWHINADEPDILDYDTSFKQDAQDALYQPNPFRASDHDPVIVGLALNPGQQVFLPLVRR